MNTELHRLADKKWQAFYSASSAAGIWLIAFIAAFALAVFGKDVGVFVGILLVVTFAMLVVLSILVLSEMIKAQAASRKASTSVVTQHHQDA